MDHLERVQVRKRVEQLTEEPLGLGLGAGAALVEEPLQRGAVAQLHHQGQLAIRLDVRREEARDVRVAQRYADVQLPPHVLGELDRVDGFALAKYWYVDDLERRVLVLVIVLAASVAHSPDSGEASGAKRCVGELRPPGVDVGGSG
eukprot:2906736-Prymnesium_polylepis.1